MAIAIMQNRCKNNSKRLDILYDAEKQVEGSNNRVAGSWLIICK